MERVLADLNWTECLCYLDDIIVLGRDFEEHLQNLRKVFLRLRESNLSLSGDKCELARREVKYLGHIVSEEGIRPDPQLLQAIRDIPPPSTVKQVRSFLGLAGYYRFRSRVFRRRRPPLRPHP